MHGRAPAAADDARDAPEGWGGLVIDEEAWTTVTYDKLSAWGHRPQQVVADLLKA